MKSDLIKQLTSDFESAAYTAEDVKCWYARDLQKLLGYTEWRNFLFVVEKAKIACQNAGQEIEDHFVGINKMMIRGKRNGPGIAPEAVKPGLLTLGLLKATTWFHYQSPDKRSYRASRCQFSQIPINVKTS